LMIFAGLTLTLTDSLILMVLAAVVGTISPNGSEVGPFSSIEQAALPQTIDNRFRTPMFAWYNLSGYVAAAFGAFCAGALAGALQRAGSTPLESYRLILLGYAALGVLLLFLYTRLSPQMEVAPSATGSKGRVSLHRSRGVVFRLSALFIVDSFAGSLVLQSVLAYWFSLRYGVQPELLGSIFFGVNLLAGISALAAGRLAGRFGLVNTMVWTHIPSNIFLMLVPLMPTLPLAILVLLARASISQMDVPTRQSYIMAVVDPDERSAAAGVTTLARTAASAAGPAVTGVLFGLSLFSAPFLIAGALKIGYDLALWRGFRALKPPEEIERG
jgi:predicted MFS family arabinose efflux permease